MDIDMDGELNGRTEWGYHDPEVQNQVWARHLAEMALARPQETDQDPRLSMDVIAVVAETLAGARDLETLAKLNVVSRDVHEGTLPVLYETVRFNDERAFTQSVNKTNNKGWRYTKFLFVSDVTAPLLRLHQRYQSDSATDDLTVLFPRLTLLGLVKLIGPDPPLNHAPPLHITLYRPIRLPTLLSASMAYGPDAHATGITFFGTYYLRKQHTPGLPPRIKPHAFRDIVALELRKGAYIMNPKLGVDGWRATFCGERFKLAMEDGGDAGVEDTLRTVVDRLCLYAASRQVKAKGVDVRFHMKCSPDILTRFIQLFRDRPCFLDLEVELTAPVTRSEMLEFVTSLADVYSLHWTHRPTVTHSMLFQIHARAPTMFPEWVEPGVPIGEDEYTMWHGEGCYGWQGGQDFDDERDDIGGDAPDGADHEEGFTAMISRALMGGGIHQHGEQFWVRSYPCAHVPVPAEDAPMAQPPMVPEPAEPPVQQQALPEPTETVRAILRTLQQGGMTEEQARATLAERLAARPQVTDEQVQQAREQMAMLRLNPALLREVFLMNPAILEQMRGPRPEPLPQVMLTIAQHRVDEVERAIERQGGDAHEAQEE